MSRLWRAIGTVSFFLLNPLLYAQGGSSVGELSSFAIPLWLIVSVILAQMLAILFLIKNIRSRKLIEGDLVESQRMLQDVLDTIPVRVYWKDRNSIFLGCNQLVALDAAKDSPEEVIGRTDNDFSWSEHAARYRADDQEVMTSGKPKLNYEEAFVGPNGNQNWLKTSKIPLRNNAGEIYGILGTSEDITNQKAAEEEIRQNEYMMRSLNSNLPGVVFQFVAKDNGDWGMSYVSERSKGILGLDSELSSYVERFITSVHEDEREAFVKSIQQVVEKVIPWEFEGRLIKGDNETVYFRANSAPHKEEGQVIFYGLILDVTEQRKVEEQLHHSNKMEAIGQLAGGVAHDFNNMLGGIMIGAEILEKYLTDHPKAKRFQQIIIESAEHASQLTQQLLTFSRKEPVSVKSFDIHEIAEAVANILKKTVDKRILIKNDLKAPQSIINGDASHIQSAILNLAINSSHSMPEGGIINILTKETEISAEYCRGSRFDLTAGKYLEIEVRDNGCGIAQANLDRIFEPFFTTKKQGQGTGLGLAAVYGTVQQHKGEISVFSELEKGTSFRILLPLAEEALELAEAEEVSRHKGEGCILVIDDEEVMRLSAEALLNEFGYEVKLAKDGQEGLEMFVSDPDAYDMVLLDMVMPDMNGRDCFLAMRKFRQDIPVVLSSGYGAEDDIEEMKAKGLTACLPKPYSRADMNQLLDDIFKK